MSDPSSTGPILTGFTLPSDIDVTNGGVVETLQASATDADATVTSIEVDLNYNLLGQDGQTDAPTREIIYPYAYYENGESHFNASFLVNGDAFSSIIYVSPDTPSNAYSVLDVKVTDLAGAVTTYTPSQLSAMGFSTGFQVTSAVPADTTPPTLTSLAVPGTVDLTHGASSQVFTATAADGSGTGADGLVLQLSGPTSGLSIDLSGLNGTLSGTSILPLNVAPGTYQITGAVLSDLTGNSMSYTATQLQAMGDPTSFQVATDTTPPTLTSLTLPTDAGVPNASFGAQASDGGTGVVEVVLALDHAYHTATGTSNQIILNPEGHTAGGFGQDITFGAVQDPGVYNIVNATVYDAAGNSAIYTAAQLQAMGDATSFTVTKDTTHPVLTSLSFASEISVQQGGAFQEFQVGVSDVGSGVVSATIQLDRAVGYGVLSTTLTATQTPGEFTSLTPEAEITTATPSGTYNITALTLKDAAGNTTTYTAAQLQAMGDQTSFTVDTPTAAPSLGTGFTATGDNQTLTAPASGQAYFEADGANDRVVLNGNVGDYTLSRVQPTVESGATAAQVGAFLLTATNGSGAYAIEEGVSTIQFQNGQYLSLKDLPAYIHGDADLQTGGSANDLLFQNINEPYQLFVGGGGTDRVYLNGNVGDYTLQPFTAVTPTGADGNASQTYGGLELVANNGSGALLIDSSVETVQFKDGQYLSYGDLHSYVAASANPSSVTLDIGLPGDFSEPLAYAGTTGPNIALLNGNVGDYTLSRDAAGDFVLDEHYATNGVENTLTIGDNVTAVQFRDGQYLSLKDLGAYIAGSDAFTQGTSANDLLFVPAAGDSYVTGGGGDNLYLNGNTRDYTIQSVDLAATSSHPAVDGYELVADNGSGNIYIDQSVGTVHFQDGQYLAFHDLPSYIDPFHG